MSVGEHGPVTILVADDESMVRAVTVAMLETLGYRVLTAENGHRAVQIADSFPGDIHVAFCDIRMEGPSGVDLRNRILRDRPGTKVVLWSGDTSFARVPDDVPKFPKPFTLDQIDRCIRNLLRRE